MEFVFLDEAFHQISVLDSYESMIWVDRYNKPGEFEIYTGVTQGMLDLLKIHESLYIWCELSEHIMAVETYEVHTDFDEGSKIAITGRSVESLLELRVVMGNGIVKGSVDDSIYRLVDENLTNPSDPNRKYQSMIFVKSKDPEISKVVHDGDYSGQTLLEAIQDICKETDLGFKMNLIEYNETEYRLEVSLYKGKDRSYDQLENPYVIFSPDFENLSGSNYVHSNVDYKNVAVIVTENEDKTKHYDIYDPEKKTGLKRREVPATTIINKEEQTESNKQTIDVVATGKKALSENKQKIAYEGKIDSDRVFVYGVDFNLGDIVQIRNEYGFESTARITELVINQDANDYRMYPTFESLQKGE